MLNYLHRWSDTAYTAGYGFRSVQQVPVLPVSENGESTRENQPPTTTKKKKEKLA